MISQITCDTPISDIISEEDVAPLINNLESEINSFMTSIKSLVTEEEANGLSASAFNIDNKALLVERSSKFVSNIKLLSSFENLKSSIIDNLKEQRKKELQALYDKLVEKINSLTTKYNSLVSEYNSTTDQNTRSSLKSQFEELGSIIDKYDSKLNTVKGLM